MECINQMQKIELTLHEKQLKHDMHLSEVQMETGEKNKKWLEKTLKTKEER
jgi:archaellum biogenesis ATPase FlaH